MSCQFLRLNCICVQVVRKLHLNQFIQILCKYLYPIKWFYYLFSLSVYRWFCYWGTHGVWWTPGLELQTLKKLGIKTAHWRLKNMHQVSTDNERTPLARKFYTPDPLGFDCGLEQSSPQPWPSDCKTDRVVVLCYNSLVTKLRSIWVWALRLAHWSVDLYFSTGSKKTFIVYLEKTLSVLIPCNDEYELFVLLQSDYILCAILTVTSRWNRNKNCLLWYAFQSKSCIAHNCYMYFFSHPAVACYSCSGTVNDDGLELENMLLWNYCWLHMMVDTNYRCIW